jgi:membrane dipeptidase
LLVIDSHLDLALNAMNYNRDLTKSVSEIRRLESNLKDYRCRGNGTVSFPEMIKGEVFLSLGTVFARLVNGSNSSEIAYASAKGQLEYYRILESQGKLRIIKDSETLEKHVEEWNNKERKDAILGIILANEGGDAIYSPEQVKSWWDDGLRVNGLSHYGPSKYAHGTGTTGGLSNGGRKLLETMDSIGMILDVSHLSDDSFWEALDVFKGPVLASHNNCRALVPGDRQLTDEQIKALIKRNAVIGSAADAWMLYPGWNKNTSNRVVNIETIIDHINHVCLLAGNTYHAGLGTDLDGGYGTEQTPHDIDTIADLQKIPDLLEKRDYSEADIERIMYKNWLKHFRNAWKDL